MYGRSWRSLRMNPKENNSRNLGINTTFCVPAPEGVR